MQCASTLLRMTALAYCMCRPTAQQYCGTSRLYCPPATAMSLDSSRIHTTCKKSLPNSRRSYERTQGGRTLAPHEPREFLKPSHNDEYEHGRRTCTSVRLVLSVACLGCFIFQIAAHAQDRSMEPPRRAVGNPSSGPCVPHCFSPTAFLSPISISSSTGTSSRSSVHNVS